MDSYDHRNSNSYRINDNCYSFKSKFYMAGNNNIMDWGMYAQTKNNRKYDKEIKIWDYQSHPAIKAPLSN